MAKEKSGLEKYLVPGAILAGALAFSGAIAWGIWDMGKNVKSGLEKGIGNGLGSFLPDVNVTMPSIRLPDVNLPSINLGVGISGLGDKLVQEATTWFQGSTPNSTGPIVPASNPLSSANTNQARKAAVQDGTFWSGGIFTSDLTAPPTPSVQKSTGEGGNGIFVENGDKDYYVPDNSLYGGSSGMPAPQVVKSDSPVVPSAPTITNAPEDFKAVEEWSKKNSGTALGGWYVDSVTNTWRQR